MCTKSLHWTSNLLGIVINYYLKGSILKGHIWIVDHGFGKEKMPLLEMCCCTHVQSKNGDRYVPTTIFEVLCSVLLSSLSS